MTSAQGTPQQGMLIPLSLRNGTASELADLVSIMGDLGFTRQCADGYLRWLEQTGDEAELIKRAVWTACCISYRRVFTKGKGHLASQKPRLKLKETWTENLTADQLAVHDSVLASANQHVAHRVSDLEQVLVQGLLAPPPMPREVVGIATPVLHLVGATREDAEHLVSICDLLLGVSQQQWDLFANQITAHLKGQDINELYLAAERQTQADSS